LDTHGDLLLATTRRLYNLPHHLTMIRLEDTNASSNNPNPSLNDLTALKNLQEREQASTPVSIVRRF